MTEGTCYFCDNDVTEDNFCPHCKYFICSICDPGESKASRLVNHCVSDHLDPADD